MMLDIMKCIKLFPVQNNYPLTLFIFNNFYQKKKDIDNQKVNAADKIIRDIWKHLVSSDLATDALYNYAHTIFSCAK